MEGMNYLALVLVLRIMVMVMVKINPFQYFSVEKLTKKLVGSKNGVSDLDLFFQTYICIWVRTLTLTLGTVGYILLSTTAECARLLLSLLELPHPSAYKGCCRKQTRTIDRKRCIIYLSLSILSYETTGSMNLSSSSSPFPCYIRSTLLSCRCTVLFTYS